MWYNKRNNDYRKKGKGNEKQINIIFRKINKVFYRIIRKKSADYTSTGKLDSILTPFGLGFSKGIGWLSSLGAINYYDTVSPIANAVDLIAETGSRIYLAIYDKRTKEYIKDNIGNNTPAKALKLLAGGNYTQTYTEFMRSLMSYYLITGNAFVIAQSTSENTDIIELFSAKPQDFIIQGAGTSLATTYYYQDGDRKLTFRLNFSNFRYEAKDSNGFYYELKHIKNFNPKYSVGNLWGMSVLTQVYLEMEQYIAGAVHNQALLNNGVKPSGVLTLDEEMSDNAYERARKEFQDFYSGAENAGKVLIFEGNNAKFESFSISPKDMDYANLIEKVENALYSRLKIPRPLISDKSMTYNNLSEALRQLYILAVFPSFDMILEGLTQLVFSRAKDGENYEIYYDTKDIEAFADKFAEQDEKIVRLGITTYNEARSKYNLPDLAENGDTVFYPPSMAPLGDAIPPEQVAKTQTKGMTVPIEEFRRILKKQNFNTEEIDRAVEKIYGRQ